MKNVLFWLILAFLGLLLISTGAVMSQGTSDIPRVSITVTSEGFTFPQGIPEGAVQITFENNTEAPVAPSITRLHEGETVDALIEAYAQPDPAASLSLSSSLGGMMVMPGSTLNVTFLFVPGSLLVSNLFGGEEFVSFTILDSEGAGAALPDAHLRIEFVDFAFNTPIAVSAGRKGMGPTRPPSQVQDPFLKTTNYVTLNVHVVI